MFSFFTKKYFLVDSLKDFVDIHNHILPGIDDGAQNVDESIQLIQGFGEIGISRFIATPHIMHNYYENDSKTINASLALLKAGLLENKMKDVSIEVAAEHMIDDNFETLLEAGSIMPIRKEFILIEMSFLQPFINFKAVVESIKKKGYYPILAHPERYNFIRLNSRKYAEYKKQGILFQMNLLSLGDYYDAETQKKALKLLKDGNIDFIASDVHNLKHLEAIKNITLSKQKIAQLVRPINNTIEVFY